MPERISKNGTSVPNAERPSGVLLVDVSRGSSGWCDHLWLDFVVASVVVAVLVLVLVNSEIRVVYDAFPVRGQAEVFVFLAVVAPLRLLGSGRGRRGRNSFLRVVTHFQNCKQGLFEQIGFMTLVVASQSAVLCCRMGAWVVPGWEFASAAYEGNSEVLSGSNAVQLLPSLAGTCLRRPGGRHCSRTRTWKERPHGDCRIGKDQAQGSSQQPDLF